MSASWRHWFGLTALSACLLSGCVERRFVITTDPPGAMVIDENGRAMGPAPVDRQWTYNGVYEFQLIKDGFQTQIVRENVAPRWYQYIGIDFIAENVVPWTIRDIRRFHYQLQPMPVIPENVLREQGQALRQRGQAIGTPAAGDPLTGVPPVTFFDGLRTPN